MARAWNLPERDATPESVFLNRRELLGRGALALSGLALPDFAVAQAQAPSRPYPAALNAALSVDLPTTDETLATSYNNFYEFGSDKRIAARAQKLTLDPWSIEVGGLVERPGPIAFEDLERRFALEERVYRFRCVEAWSMVVPWTGFPLSALLDHVGVKPEARFVKLQTFHRPGEALGQVLTFWYPWPYTEGLTVKEARNPLTLLATGAYGRPLEKQQGAPIRLITPWKYGFKSIKSIVKLDLVTERPETFWNTAAPDEYGFYANVNPDVPHPRWSQATEKLLGSDERQPTLLYNGYAEWVADLYRDLDEA